MRVDPEVRGGPGGGGHRAHAGRHAAGGVRAAQAEAEEGRLLRLLHLLRRALLQPRIHQGLNALHEEISITCLGMAIID